MIAFISWCLFGLFAGAVSRLLAPGHARVGLMGTILLGILGAFVGGAISSLLDNNHVALQTLQPAGFLGAVIGGIVVLMIPRILLPKNDG